MSYAVGDKVVVATWDEILENHREFLDTVREDAVETIEGTYLDKSVLECIEASEEVTIDYVDNGRNHRVLYGDNLTYWIPKRFIRRASKVRRA